MRQQGGKPSLGAGSSMTYRGENEEDAMFRLLTIVAVVAAFGVSAAPAPAAGTHHPDIVIEGNTDAPTWPFAAKRPWWWPIG